MKDKGYDITWCNICDKGIRNEDDIHYVLFRLDTAEQEVRLCSDCLFKMVGDEDDYNKVVRESRERKESGTRLSAKGGAGHHLNVNVLNREKLIDAMNNPEDYPQLTVRVSGYAVNFIRLSKEQQLEVINRTFHDLI